MCTSYTFYASLWSIHKTIWLSLIIKLLYVHLLFYYDDWKEIELPLKLFSFLLLNSIFYLIYWRLPVFSVPLNSRPNFRALVILWYSSPHPSRHDPRAFRLRLMIFLISTSSYAIHTTQDFHPLLSLLYSAFIYSHNLRLQAVICQFFSSNTSSSAPFLPL